MATVFTVTLTGEQETPPAGPTGSQASGEGTVVWDPQAQVAAYTFTVHGLDFGPATGQGETTPSTADNVTNAHFHSAPPGVAGPVVFGQIAPEQDNDDLVVSQHTDDTVRNADDSWTVSGVWDLGDPANVPISNFADRLTAAQPGSEVALYWNVHTTVFPAGEIRGQLVAAEAEEAGMDVKDSNLSPDTPGQPGPIDRDALAANAQANFEATGMWFVTDPPGTPSNLPPTDWDALSREAQTRAETTGSWGILAYSTASDAFFIG